MLAIFQISTILAFAFNVAAGPVPNISKGKHGWTRGCPAPGDGPIRLSIALKLDDSGAKAVQHLQRLSSLHSQLYRKWLTSEQASLLATPQQQSIERVSQWLAQHDLLTSASSYEGMFFVDTTVRQAESLLNATYWVYSDGVREAVRTDVYHMPDDVAREVDFVAPTTVFPKASTDRPHPNLALVSTDDSPEALEKRQSTCGANDYVTPTCVRQVYDIKYQAKPDRVTFAIYATERATFSGSDLHKYLQKHNPPAAAANAQYRINGNGDKSEGKGGLQAAIETALDTQTALGLAWPAQGVLYNRGGVFGPNPGQIYDPFVAFLQELIHNKTVPSVVSFSEGMAEDQIDPSYAKRLCSMMAQVGSRGVTLLFSSGDNGPSGDTPSGTHKQIFEPDFPASCPWITAVGGTTNLAAETAATQSTIPIANKLGYTASGGGFSNLFTSPAYQKPTTDSYIYYHTPEYYNYLSGFNPSGRGIPDVSAFSTNFPVVASGFTLPVGGTSASTPLWAGIVALLNDYEASKGRPPLGFINPLLYKLKSGLKDITTGGNNRGLCNALAGCHLSETRGYNVTEGWDPVTGLGTPMFSALLQALDDAAAVMQY